MVTFLLQAHNRPILPILNTNIIKIGLCTICQFGRRFDMAAFLIIFV